MYADDLPIDTSFTVRSSVSLTDPTCAYLVGLSPPYKLNPCAACFFLESHLQGFKSIHVFKKKSPLLTCTTLGWLTYLARIASLAVSFNLSGESDNMNLIATGTPVHSPRYTTPPGQWQTPQCWLVTCNLFTRLQPKRLLAVFGSNKSKTNQSLLAWLGIPQES